MKLQIAFGMRARAQKPEEREMPTKSYHLTIDLAGGLQLSDRKLRGMIVKNGRPLAPHEARALFVEKLREGFDVLPMCDHHDERGYCLGHEVPEPAEGGDHAR